MRCGSVAVFAPRTIIMQHELQHHFLPCSFSVSNKHTNWFRQFCLWLFLSKNILTNRYGRSQFSYFTSNFLVFKCRHDIFPQCKLSQGLAGHILFMLVSAWFVFCPFFFLFQGLVSNSSGLEGHLTDGWKVESSMHMYQPAANGGLSLLHTAFYCLAYSRCLVFSGLPGIRRTVTHPTGWTTPKSWQGGACKPSCTSKHWCVTQDKVSSKLKVRQNNFFSTHFPVSAAKYFLDPV